MTTVRINGREIGDRHPAYICGEIGINHNGEMDDVKKLIDVASESGCDAIKFQKRTPKLCVPMDQREKKRDTPWGVMTYMDYRYRVEFDEKDYAEINDYAKSRNIDWFVSCWDVGAVDFMENFDPIAYKVASASLTDHDLLKKLISTGRPLIVSTGMSTVQEIEGAVGLLDLDNTIICHTTSSYPCKPEQLNLRMINTLAKKYNCPIGYSGHEVGLQTTVAAVALGASFIERHITLDRTLWGSDQAASVEPQGLALLCRDIRVVEQAMGDGVKKVYDDELPIRAKLRVNV